MTVFLFRTKIIAAQRIAAARNNSPPPRPTPTPIAMFKWLLSFCGTLVGLGVEVSFATAAAEAAVEAVVIAGVDPEDVEDAEVPAAEELLRFNTGRPATGITKGTRFAAQLVLPFEACIQSQQNETEPFATVPFGTIGEPLVARSNFQIFPVSAQIHLHEGDIWEGQLYKFCNRVRMLDRSRSNRYSFLVIRGYSYRSRGRYRDRCFLGCSTHSELSCRFHKAYHPERCSQKGSSRSASSEGIWRDQEQGKGMLV